MRKWPKGLCFVLLSLTLAGCRETGMPKEEWTESREAAVPQTASAESAAGMETEETHDADTAEEEGSFYYAYSTLQSPEERQLYREMLGSLARQEEETELSTLDQELLEPVFQCVMADHPEIFYVDGYTRTTYKLAGELKKITFSGTYTMNSEETARLDRQLETVLEDWLLEIPENADDYEKVKMLYESVILHTEYELGADNSQNICSVFLNGRSVCQGYAKALQLLCQRLEIPAMLVTGTVNGQGHAWDLIKMDGEWYYVDPTWGDASYRQGEEETPASVFPEVSYDYFGVTTKQIERTHVIGEERPLPNCTATADQYYRREGLYLETPDTEKIEGFFAQAADSGHNIVTFQCANEEVYRQTYRILIEEQKVFDYLPKGRDKVAYADSDRQLTFSFWLEQ